MRRIWIRFALVGFGIPALAALGSCTSGPAPVTATGSVRCSGITGFIAFSPPLTTSGESPETATIVASALRCSILRSDVSVISSVVVTANITGGTSSCSGFATSTAITLDVDWRPTTIGQSLVTFSGFMVASDTKGNSEFVLPGTGHGAKVQGSFAGNDRGATSTASFFTTLGTSQLSRCPTRSPGLSSIKIGTGEFTLD